MAVQLLKRPLGHKLADTELEASVTDSAGDALFNTDFAHQLSDGDYVYVISNFDSYNGFKYVDSVAYNTFKLKESEDGDYVPFRQEGTVSYYVSVLQHGWQCVHLPIVYELKSDIWPNNIAAEAYVPITIVSFENVAGYVVLNLSAAVPAPRANLDWIELVGDNDLSGAYQVIEYLQPWRIKINLAYDSGYSFTGLQVVRYYQNYCILIKIFGGLEPGHTWESDRPFVQLAILKLIPNSEGKVKFSISDYLRSQIKLRNWLTLDTLPNNLDFMTEFYIEFAESYDESDGETVTTFESEFTEDDFIGQAVNAKNPFKTISEGHLSNYVNENTYYAKWMTIQTRPIIVVNRFFDISFINQYLSDDLVITKNGVDYLTILNPGLGVIRVPVEATEDDEEICLIAYTAGEDDLSMAAFQNNPGPDVNWTTGATPNISSTSQSDILFQNYSFVTGRSYTIRIIFNSSSLSTQNIRVQIYDDSFVLQAQGNLSPADDGDHEATVTFVATASTTKIGVFKTSGVGATTITILSGLVIKDRIQITEEICMDVVEECGGTYVPEPQDIRLTEDGDFRILES